MYNVQLGMELNGREVNAKKISSYLTCIVYPHPNAFRD